MYYSDVTPPSGDWVGDVPGQVQECSQINQRKDTAAAIWKGEDLSVNILPLSP